MSKTKRELRMMAAAEDYAAEIYDEVTDFDNDEEVNKTINDFIAGAKWADQHPHWIPVEEELPPKGMEVLAWGITKPVEKGKLSFCDVFYSWRMDHKPLFYDEVDENGFCLYSLGSRSDHRGFKITHWMPLPQAPRKEDKNE